jgi:hypothetical protein
MVSTPHEYYDSGSVATKYCMLNVALGSRSWWIQIPQIIKPKKKWVKTESNPNNPSGGYWSFIKRQYGFTISEDSLHLRYGIQPGHWSSKDKKNSDHSKVYFIPWKHNTYLGQLFFAPDWAFFDYARATGRGGINFDALRDIEERVPKLKIKFNDCDGEEITATAHVVMRKYHRGTSWCKWLKYFTKPIEHYSLSVEYDKETGYEKGSWKGGVMGHSIPLEYGEDVVEAFSRYGVGTDYFKYHGKKSRGYTNIQVIASEWHDEIH